MGSRAVAAAAAPAVEELQSQDYLGDANGNGEEHGEVDIEASLDSLIDGWQETEEKTFSDPDDDKYQCEIEDAVIEHAKSSGRLQATFTLVIIHGATTGDRFANRKIFKRDGLDTEEARSWFRGGMARLGVPWPANPKELPATLQSLIGSKCQVSAVTKEGNDRQNYHFDKALDDADVVQPIETDTGYVAPAPAPARAAQPRAKAAPAQQAQQAQSVVRQAAAAPKKTAAAAPPVEESGEAAGENSVTVTFTDDDITKGVQGLIIKQAQRLDADLNSYQTTTDLMCDMAEYVGLDGEYTDPKVLIEEIAAVPVEAA